MKPAINAFRVALLNWNDGVWRADGRAGEEGLVGIVILHVKAQFDAWHGQHDEGKLLDRWEEKSESFALTRVSCVHLVYGLGCFVQKICYGFCS